MTDTQAGAGFTLELAIDPAQLERLLRSPGFQELRQGRAVGGNFRLVWHDTADGELAASGQALEVAPARRGTTQRLVQVMPRPQTPWLPGTEALVLRNCHAATATPDAAALGLDPRRPLVGLAAAEGRQRRYSLLLDGAPLTLLALNLRLRTVAAERDATRVVLAAPAGSPPGLVHEAALRLAAEAPLEPAWPLAEEARALAHAEAPRPPRRGAPELAGSLTVEEGFAQASAHLVAVLAWLAPEAARGTPYAVHQTRVAIRRLRSGFAVWRPAVSNERSTALDARLRHLADVLGPVRDRDVFLAGAMTLAEQTLEHDPRLALVRDAVQRAREAALEALASFVGGPDYRCLLLELGRFIAHQGWREEANSERLALLDKPLAEFAAAQLSRRRRRMLRGHDDLAEVPIATLHALRLSGKRLRYAVEFFASVFEARPSKSTRRYLKRLASLQEELGLVNDADVARALLQGLPPPTAKAASGMHWAVGAVTGVTAARAGLARTQAERAWDEFREAPAFWDSKPARG